MSIYCGNNRLYPGLVNGSSQLGTRNQCFRKGFGVGSHLPYDPDCEGGYDSLDGVRYYCGNEAILPNGYDRFGNLSQCLQKGVGVGKCSQNNNVRTVRARRTRKIKIILLILVFLILVGGVFSALYFTKPDFVSKYDDHNVKVIDWSKFAPYYAMFVIILIIIFYIIFKIFLRK